MSPSDQGATTVEWAIWSVPAILMVIGLLQFAMWWVARDVSITAAQQGLTAGRVLGGSPGAAQSAAQSFVARAGTMVSDPAVSTAGTTETSMRVEVSVTVKQVIEIPGFNWRVRQAVAGARERFTTPAAGARP
jgi:hypothetical protein